MTLMKNDKNFFDRMMSVEGKIFRQQKNRCTLRFEDEGQAYFIKKHGYVSWREIFKNLLQGRLPVIGAKNEYRANQLLKNLGLPTIDIVKFAERGWNPAKRESFLISKELTDCVSFEDLVRLGKLPFYEKQHLIKKLAEITRIMHQHGINHRDYYLCHIWWRRETDEFFIMDLHRAQIRKTVPKRWLIKDLAGLYFSSMDAGLTQRDIFRFLRVYFQQPLSDIFKMHKALLQASEVRAKHLYHKESHHA